MLQRKLRFSNRWMFNKVMMEEPICKHVIQAILGVEVERIDYLNSEQTIEPDPESRGVRMDVYVREGKAGAFTILKCRRCCRTALRQAVSLLSGSPGCERAAKGSRL